MKCVAGSALIVGIITGAIQPAHAASLDAGPAAGERSMGAFAGARLRLSLGAAPNASAAFAITPMQRSIMGDGAVRMRFGEGLSFGTDGREPVALRLAGMRVDRLGLAPNGRVDERAGKHGISTLGYVAIGVGCWPWSCSPWARPAARAKSVASTAVVVFALGEACRTGEICGIDRDG
jgi:hypothetical protein